MTDLELKKRLQSAVRNQPAPPYLEARIRGAIHGAADRGWSWRRMVPLATAAGVCFGALIAYEVGHLRFTVASQELYIASVTNRIATLMRAGLGDHLHCTVFRKFPKDPEAAAKLTAELGPAHRELVPVLQHEVPEGFRLVLAHECRYHDREFVHLSFRNGAELLSLVVTRKRTGESFEIENVLPSLVQSGVAFYRTSVQRYEVAAFETSGHLVYLVSGLSEDNNLQILTAIAPQVKELLLKIEG